MTIKRSSIINKVILAGILFVTGVLCGGEARKAWAKEEKPRLELQLETLEEGKKLIEADTYTGAVCPVRMVLQIRDDAADLENMVFMLSMEDDEGKTEVLLEETELQWTEADSALQAEILLEEEGVYEAALIVPDKEGNLKEPLTRKIILDWSAPELSVGRILTESGEKTEAHEGTYYSKDGILFEILCSDTKSGAGKLSLFARSDAGREIEEQYAAEEDAGKDYIWKYAIKEKGVWEVFAKCEDRFGNQSEEYNLGNVCIETEVPELTLTLSGETGNRGFYTGDVTMSVEAADDISGVKSAGIELNGSKWKEWVFREKKGTFTGTEVIPAKEYQGDVEIRFWCADAAGNIAETEALVKIDAKAPEAELIFDAAAAENGKYYGKSRRAKLCITEEHFLAEGVQVLNGSRQIEVPGFSAGKGNNSYETWIILEEEGVYDLHIICEDAAGNKKELEQEEPFIIDRTRPVIQVIYEGEAESNGTADAFNSSRRAKVFVKDDNPDLNQWIVTVTKDGLPEDHENKVQDISSQKQGMSGVIAFDEEGLYKWTIQTVDLAGNTSAVWESEAFLLDFTEPRISLEGVTEESSISGAVSFAVTGEDLNYLKESLEITIFKDGEKIELPLSCGEKENEERIRVREVPAERVWDGRYQIGARCMDRAGNACEEEWEFIINRFGSDVSLESGLSNAVDKYYVNKMPSVRIIETTPDILVEQMLMLSDEKGLSVLKAGIDYSVSCKTDDRGWNQYVYCVYEHVFDQDGAYEISLHSKDRAGNTMDTRNTRGIRFFLDRKGPEVVIKENDAERSENRTYSIKAAGRSPLSRLAFYIDGKETAVYSAKEIEEAEGVFFIEAKNGGTQLLTIEAVDMAGNVLRSEPYKMAGKTEEANKEDRGTSDKWTADEEVNAKPDEEKADTMETRKLWAAILCVLLMAAVLYIIRKKFLGRKTMF